MTLLNSVDKRTATICMIGLGYVGLPTAIFWRERIQVIGRT